MTDDGGRVEPTKRQARTEREDGSKVDGLGLEGDDWHGNLVPSPRKTQLKLVAGISHILLPFLAHSARCAGSVRANVVKISGHEWKTGRRGRVNDLQHMHMLIGIVYRKVRGIFIPHCNTLPSLVYKGGRGPL